MKETDVTLDKLPPQNVEAEQSVLGAILLDNNALTATLELVGKDDFYKDSHRKIFASMEDLFDKSEPIDIITLTDYLKRKNELEAIGESSISVPWFLWFLPLRTSDTIARLSGRRRCSGASPLCY